MADLRFVDVGEGITEGHIQKWLVNDGDEVKEDEPVVQIETDKAVVNIPAPVAGTIKIVAKENTDVKVGDVLATVGGGGAEVPKAASPKPPQQTQQTPAQQTQQATAPQAEQAPASQAQKASALKAEPQQHAEVLATPAVRKLARDMHIDITKVVGTGPNGRVLENDLKMGTAVRGLPKTAPKFSEVLEEQHGEEIARVPMSQTRKAIAKNMELSGLIPRAVHFDLADATALYNVVSKEKVKVKEQLGVKLTFLPYIIKATIEALKEQPNFNASYDHDKQEIIQKHYYNIGLAAESEDGLKIIVIKNADKLPIVGIAKEIERLAGKIKDKTITVEEMRDSTFTITNVGSIGSGFLAVAMINPPEVAILAVNRIRDEPVVSDGMVKIGKILPFSISFDHRVVDGAEAVKFGETFMKYVQDPDFLEMLG